MEVETMTEIPFMKEFKRMLPARKVRVAWAVFAVAFAWFFWPSINRMVRTWWNQDDYHFAFLVPFFALFLLWHRRELIPRGPGKGAVWGVPILCLWAVMQWTAVYFNYGSLPELSILPFLAGVTVVVGGWQGLRWAWPAIVFLTFLVPLPGAVQDFSREQLQKLATGVSVFIIQTLGIPSISEGNVIQLTDKSLPVAEACSGLRMMMLFFAICVGAAFLSRKPWWEKLIMVFSAAPIAVVANVTRIVLTGVLFEVAGYWASVIDLERVEDYIHDGAGLLMMPVGLGLLLLEMWLLSRLFLEPANMQLPVSRRVSAGGGIVATALQRERRDKAEAAIMRGKVAEPGGRQK